MQQRLFGPPMSLLDNQLAMHSCCSGQARLAPTFQSSSLREQPTVQAGELKTSLLKSYSLGAALSANVERPLSVCSVYMQHFVRCIKKCVLECCLTYPS